MAISLNDLETHLFKCADIIRDAVDPTDYKEYILPLVYYKSISDEFEKQYAENVEEYGKEFARRDNRNDPNPTDGSTFLIKNNCDLRVISLRHVTGVGAFMRFAYIQIGLRGNELGGNKRERKKLE